MRFNYFLLKHTKLKLYSYHLYVPLEGWLGGAIHRIVFNTTIKHQPLLF